MFYKADFKCLMTTFSIPKKSLKNLQFFTVTDILFSRNWIENLALEKWHLVAFCYLPSRFGLWWEPDPIYSESTEISEGGRVKKLLWLSTCGSSALVASYKITGCYIQIQYPMMMKDFVLCHWCSLTLVFVIHFHSLTITNVF